MSLIDFSLAIELSETTEKVSEIRQISPDLFINGRFYTADGRIYRAYKQRAGFMLVDVNKSFRIDACWVIVGLFEHEGVLYYGEKFWNGYRAKWTVMPVKSPITPDSMTLCDAVIEYTIDLGWNRK